MRLTAVFLALFVPDDKYSTPLVTIHLFPGMNRIRRKNRP
ncbi:hypothetical protein EDF60_1590 [Leucobacter luti]|nr:hypothetical protein [Leucobacter luti]TCK41172.1 hypothetical protein EDF60_1590 [Leucobacter luti]